ncbi:unnamed protein product [Peronospora destructor]|uniref:Mediator complex subunit 4 n=1 Tax=Peronospora destructor TaxID=86335 RepID=A0AAV0VFF6_9STRA|nr:unnamed protein product [Peronospora destructor]
MGGSIREEVQVALHEHRFLVTKLLESLNTAPPSTITTARLRTVTETFHKVLEKDRNLLAAVKKLSRHQVAQTKLLRIKTEIENKKTKEKAKVVLDPRDIIAYVHRIAGTTSAPKDWQPRVLPMFGFMPPAPQEDMMRAESWKMGDALPTDAMEILRKKFKLPEKRAALYDDEVVDDVETLRKKRKLEEGEKTDNGIAESESSCDSSDRDEEAPNTILLSLSSSESDSDSD